MCGKGAKLRAVSDYPDSYPPIIPARHENLPIRGEGDRLRPSLMRCESAYERAIRHPPYQECLGRERRTRQTDRQKLPVEREGNSVGSVGFTNGLKQLPIATRQTLRVASLELTEATDCPSGEKATWLTATACPPASHRISGRF